MPPRNCTRFRDPFLLRAVAHQFRGRSELGDGEFAAIA
jgi:hypothetical protein